MMTLTTNMAAAKSGAEQRRRAESRARKQEALKRGSMENFKEAERSRVSVCAGCHILGWYEPGTPLARVLGALTLWSAEPDHHPGRSGMGRYDFWEWEPGETLAVWHAGRVLALAAKRRDGTIDVVRLPA